MIAALSPTSRLQINDPFRFAELERITGLQVVKPMAPEEIEAFNVAHVQAQAYQEGFRLNALQCEGVSAYQIHNGLFGKLAVGSGKTATSLMCAAHAMSKGLSRLLLFIPSGNLNQLVQTDIAWARTRVHINYPIHVLGGRKPDFRTALAKSGRKGLYVVPYSLLSTKDTSEILDGINPELIIADEAHRLANFSAALTRRVSQLIHRLDKEKRPAELVILSGTITGKSIKDYAHLIKWCLKAKSPLPMTDGMAADWAQMIDANASNEEYYNPANAAGYDSMLPLIHWSKQNFPEEAKDFAADVIGFRKAFGLRLNSAPGVVSGGTDIGTSLYLCNEPAPFVENTTEFQALKGLTEKVIDQNLTPNGDEIQYAIHQWKWLNELSAGFYNELTWPTPEAYATRKKITLAEATDLLERAKIHHKAGQVYNHLLRPWLEDKSFAGCDTPMLVGLDMARNGAKNVPTEMYEAWRDWKDLEFPSMPERDSRGVRVCDFKIKAAVKWAQETLHRDGGIIWYYHQEVGRWLVEALKEGELGPRVLHAPAGDPSNRALDVSAGNQKRVIVASIEAHGTGKNLQYMQHMYLSQWIRSAKDMEQLIGRLHRQGQEADELVVTTNITLPFEERNVAATLNDSLYIHQSTGDRQKLIYATYDPLPKIYPASVLIEAGLEAKRLSLAQERMLREKFGEYAKGSVT